MLKRWFKQVGRQVRRYHTMLQGFERATSQAADPSMAYVQWGVEQADGGDINGSIEKFRQAVALSPNRPEGYTNWGVALAKLGQLDDAIDKFKQAIDRAPQHATNYMLLGAALLEKGELEDAATYYAKASELEPNNTMTIVNHGVALARRGLFPEAIQRFKQALSRHKHQPHVYFLWGASLAEMQQHEAAIEKFKLTVRYMPKHIEALHFWSVSLNELGHYKEALTKSQEVLALAVDKADIYLNIGDALANLGEFTPALQAYEQALQLDNTLLDGYISLGMLYTQLHQWEKADTTFETARQLDPEDETVLRTWALALNQAGHHVPGAYERAVALLEPYCYGHPDDWAAHYQLTLARFHLNHDHALIDEALSDLLDSRPEDADALGLRADLALRQQQPQQALRLLQRVMATGPSLERALQLGQLMLDAGHTKDTLHHLRPWYRKHPTHAEVCVLYAKALKMDGHWREALQKLEAVIKHHPSHVEAMRQMAEGYLDARQPAQAQVLVQSLLTLQPEAAMTRWLQARLLLAHYRLHPKEDVLLSLQTAVEALLTTHPNHQPGLVMRAFLNGLQNRAAGETQLQQVVDQHHHHSANANENANVDPSAAGHLNTDDQSRLVAYAEQVKHLWDNPSWMPAQPLRYPL
jgi:tetratricopeptide (TPR) repeat protein